MTITAQDIIKRAMRLGGVTDPEEAPSTQEYVDGLYALNSMMDAWATEDLLVYELLDISVPLSVGVGAYTIGSGGTVNTTRPDHIVDAYLVNGGVRYPIQVTDETRAKQMVTTTVQSDYPTLLWYDSAYPLGIINVYYLPATASTTLHVIVDSQIQSFSALSTVLALPPGYQHAIEFNLAEQYAPEFGVEVSQAVKEQARRGRARLKRLNARRIFRGVTSELADSRVSRFNINTGD